MARFVSAAKREEIEKDFEAVIMVNQIGKDLDRMKRCNPVDLEASRRASDVQKDPLRMAKVKFFASQKLQENAARRERLGMSA